MTIRVVQIGLGPLGVKMIQFMNERNGIEVVGAVDVNEAIAGQDLGEFCGGAANGIKIKRALAQVLADTAADVVLLTTVSDMERITPQIEQIAALKMPIVSTCEELSCPWDIAPELSARIDAAAKANGVAVLGTGINPGFLMDYLPCVMTSLAKSVEKVEVWRMQDATFRRIPFQKKIGAGLTLEQFEAKKQSGTLRHVGLAESINMIARAMNWKLDKAVDELSPIIAEKDITTEAMSITAGDAAGVQQIGRGFVNGEEKITLTFRAAIGEKNPHDRIRISGTPTIDSIVEGGVNGDIGTCAITINAAKQILRCTPGLKTMADIPVPACFSA